jgi:hypothetical protein
MNIEELAINAYLAEKERVVARALRNCAREQNPCENYECDGGSFRCHVNQHLAFNDWCDACKKVQPFWQEYRRSAQAVRVARIKLTNAIKRKVG